MGTTGHINFRPYVDWLVNKGSNVYTQFGEDGLIAACFEKIGETNRQCFEVGAADGRFFSNTLRLREQGWNAVLIESDPKSYTKLVAEFGNQSYCVHGECKDLDKVLDRFGFETNLDLGIIDIDGQDYWLWHDMMLFEPRVMLVEISTAGGSMPVPERGEKYPAQAGLDAIKELGESKGYQLVAETHCNALFVLKSEIKE